jgi:GT2 family glycosyltransferase
VRSPAGAPEDSARRFPTALSLLRKAFFGSRGPEYRSDGGPLAVDWIGGMFMLFSAEAYRAAGGFDEAYFLYYEDVDICRRLTRSGKRVIYEPRAEIIHDARRASRRNLALAGHHIASILRFFSNQ